MAAPKIRVIEQKDIARMNVAAKCIADCLGSQGQRPDMYGNMLCLRHQAAIRTANGRGEIPARIENLGEGRAQHGLTHLFHNTNQTMLNH